MSDPLEALGALERTLEELLSALDAADGTGVLPASEACARAFESFRERFDATRAAGLEPPPALRRRMEAVLKREAVAASLVARRQEALGAELRVLREARRRLQGTAEAAPTGGSCDVRG